MTDSVQVRMTPQDTPITHRVGGPRGRRARTPTKGEARKTLVLRLHPDKNEGHPLYEAATMAMLDAFEEQLSTLRSLPDQTHD